MFFPTDAFTQMNVFEQLQETAGFVVQISLVLWLPAQTTIIGLHCMCRMCFIHFHAFKNTTQVDAALC